MRVWLIGAARIGIDVLYQMQKNEEIQVVVSDISETPPAVEEGVIEKVDYVELVTSLNVNTLARRIRPDLILIDSGAERHNLGHVTGGSVLSEALMNEIVAASDYPCLVL